MPPGSLEAVRCLLDDAFGAQFTEEDWEHALGGWHVLLSEAGLPVAHASVVPRQIEFGHRRLDAGYVEAVATIPDRQRSGHGSLAMLEVASLLAREFDVGVLSTSRHGFYERLGWERWKGPTYVRHPDRRVRSEEEDSGIMVLRFGPSIDVPLTDDMTCEARRGDDW